VVDETRRSFSYLCLYGVATDAVIVNRLLPEASQAGWFARWAAREREELAAIEAAFPIPTLRARLAPSERIGADALRALAAEVYGERDPAAILHRGRPLRWRRVGTSALLEIDLPGATKEEVEVAVHGEDLHVRVRDALRRVALPASVAGRRLAATSLQRGVLEVRFDP
jgi:arsenite-transporting ATPase